MTKFRSIRNSFLGGQVSPTCVGRTDMPQYQHSCEILQNMIPLVSGGAYVRPGTFGHGSYPLPPADGSSGNYVPRLISFIASKEEAYVLEFGYDPVNSPVSTIMAWRATGTTATGNLLGDGSGGVGIHPYKPATTTTMAVDGNPDDEIFSVQYAQSVDVMWLVHPNHKPQMIRRLAIDTFTIGDFDVVIPKMRPEINVSRCYPYRKQNANGNIQIAPSNTTGNITLTLTHTTADDPFGLGVGVGFTSGQYLKDTIIRLLHPTGVTPINKVGAAIITGFVSTTTVGSTVTSIVNATVLDAFGGTGAVKEWWESAWSPYRGWPGSVAIFQERLCMGGTPSQRDTVWFSETGNFFKFSVLNDPGPAGSGVIKTTGNNFTVTSDSIHLSEDTSEGDGQTDGPRGGQPFSFAFAQSQFDRIQWMSPDKELLVGTTGSEWLIASVGGSFDVANSVATQQSKYGSAKVPAVRIGYELMFATPSNEIRAYQYNYIDASFFAEPVQLMFDEYPKPEVGTKVPSRRKIRDMAWDGSRNTLWCIDTAGNFYGMTRDRKLQVTMWHTHQFGGYDPTKGNIHPTTLTDPAYFSPAGSAISMAITPNPQTGINDVWLIVKRSTSGGFTQWFLERMVGTYTQRPSAYSDFSPARSPNEPVYVDCARVFTDNADPTDLGYFMNFTQFIDFVLTGTYYSKTYGLFKIQTDGPVSSFAKTNLLGPMPPDYGTGSFTLGFPYTAIIQPTRIEAGSMLGIAQGAIKRVNRAFLRLYKSMMVKVGSPPSSGVVSPLETIRFSGPGVSAKSPEIFTGDKRVQVPSTYDRDGYLYIVHDQPLPFFLVSIIAEGEEFD